MCVCLGLGLSLKAPLCGAAAPIRMLTGQPLIHNDAADRQGCRLLLLRHQRPHTDDVGLFSRRHGHIPADIPLAADPASGSLPRAGHGGRRCTDKDVRAKRQGGQPGCHFRRFGAWSAATWAGWGSERALMSRWLRDKARRQVRISALPFFQGTCPWQTMPSRPSWREGMRADGGAEASIDPSPRCLSSLQGEHGGDPASINFFHEIGIDYVSCSAFRYVVQDPCGATVVVFTGCWCAGWVGGMCRVRSQRFGISAHSAAAKQVSTSELNSRRVRARASVVALLSALAGPPQTSPSHRHSDLRSTLHAPLFSTSSSSSVPIARLCAAKSAVGAQ